MIDRVSPQRLKASWHNSATYCSLIARLRAVRNPSSFLLLLYTAYLEALRPDALG
jgi:hypothetical protein